MLLAKRIKELRKEKDLTQEDLGKLINVTKVSICCYENGTRIPSLETVVALADVFEVSLDNLLGREMEVVAKKRKTRMSKEEVEFIKEIRKSERVFHLLTTNPKRCASLIDKKLNWKTSISFSFFL